MEGSVNVEAGNAVAVNPQLNWIRNALRTVEPRVHRLRRTDTTAIVIGTLASSGAAFVAGGTAMTGPMIADWVTSCTVAAGLSLAAALSTGLHKGLGVSMNLMKASACAGKLRALELAATRRGATDLTHECEAILAEYPDQLI